jgi:MFS family permease
MAHETEIQKPSRARLFVLAFLCAMAFILYLDRICMSKAVPKIQDEFPSITDTRMSYILMAFTLAYGLFEVPTGRWGDRFGSRKVLVRIVVWWSAFTALTGVCWSFWSFVVVRFLFGAGEAGAYPNAVRVTTRWFPMRERGRVLGLIQAFALVGGLVSPIIAAYIIQHLGWRIAFVIFGAVGIAWAVGFYLWFRDDPKEHNNVNETERKIIESDGTTDVPHHEPIPWAAVFRCPTIWILGVIISCSSFNSYLYFSWYPKYLEKGRGVDAIDSGWLAGMVLGAGALGTATGGLVADWLRRRVIDLRAGRRNFAIGVYLLAAVSVIASRYCDDARWSAVCAALSCFFMMNQQAIWWNAATEVSGKHVGSLFGLMNSLGVIGAMASQFFFGWFSDYRKALGFTGRDQFDPAFSIYGSLLVLAAFLWFFVNPAKSVERS